LLCLATRTYHMGISHQTWLENPWNWIWWIVYIMFDDHKMGYHNMGQWKSWYMDMDGLNNYGMWKVMFFLILDSISISHDYPIMIPNGILIRMLIFHQILALSHGRNMGPPFGWSFIGLV
jgi:hypothetical protein